MGAFKPLLPLDQQSVIETAVGAFRRSGIIDVSVVIGHRADEMSPIVKNLGAKAILNPDFMDGMYSSIKAGISAVSDRCDGCLLLPVDIPLVRPSTIEALRRRYALNLAPVLYPVFQGRRGHPPLIARQLFAEILGDKGTDGLRGVLARYTALAENVPVYDEGIHRDMDTPEDYAVLCAMARRRDIPGRAECEAILADLQRNPNIIAHVRTVAAVANTLAANLLDANVPLNVDLILAGSLLHDLAKGKSDHAVAGALLLERLGFPEVGPVVACHSDLNFFSGELDERAIVFLADKLVRGNSVVTIDERFQRSFQRLASDPEGLAAAKGRYDTAMSIISAIEERAGKSMACILASISPQPILPEID
jgi:CTP:molybdopterin cytidylyltransferase MocA